MRDAAACLRWKRHRMLPWKGLRRGFKQPWKITHRRLLTVRVWIYCYVWKRHFYFCASLDQGQRYWWRCRLHICYVGDFWSSAVDSSRRCAVQWKSWRGERVCAKGEKKSDPSLMGKQHLLSFPLLLVFNTSMNNWKSLYFPAILTVTFTVLCLYRLPHAVGIKKIVLPLIKVYTKNCWKCTFIIEKTNL